MTSPAELQAIREHDTRDFISTKCYVAGSAPIECRQDRRTLLALYDAQSVTLQQERQDRIEAQCSEERLRSGLEHLRSIVGKRGWPSIDIELSEAMANARELVGSQP